MTDYPDPGHLVPSAAIGGLAVLARAVLAENPRPWSVILTDAVATCSLVTLAYYMLIRLPTSLGGPVSPEFAGGLAGLIAVIGWGAIERAIRRFSA